MVLGYDIFRKFHDGTPLWMGTAASRADAEEQMQTFARGSNGECTTCLRQPGRAVRTFRLWAASFSQCLPTYPRTAHRRRSRPSGG